MVTTMSGKVVMNPRASSAIAARPTAGGPSLILIDPFTAKKAATFSGSWLHHALAYRFANFVTSARSGILDSKQKITPKLFACRGGQAEQARKQSCSDNLPFVTFVFFC